MKQELVYKQYGLFGMLIEWSPKIATTIIKDVNQFKQKIKLAEKDEVQDFIVGYSSLLIKYKNPVVNFLEKRELYRKIYKEDLLTKNVSYRWEVPVCYDKVFGSDLEHLSKNLNMSVNEIITLHTQTTYTVYFIGFLPGFLYLGGLNKQLWMERKSTPELRVPKGAVAIGGQQTGVYPQQSAGGWHIIGRTPINFFDLTKENPCFAKSGDEIQFVSISIAEFEHLENLVLNKNYQLIKTRVDD